MATGKDWLAKQKKADLAELADHTGLKGTEKFKKNELEVALEEHLRTNVSKYQQDSRVTLFYQGVDPASPVKHAGGKAVAGGFKEDEKEKKSRRKTVSKAQQDSSSSSSVTPSRVRSLAERVPLPPSPAVLVDKIDARTSSIRASISNTVTSSRFPRYANWTRSTFSNATALTLLSLALEAVPLLFVVLPLKYAVATPPVPALGLGPINIKLPDLFALLTLAFWGPVFIWSTFSVALPLAIGWTVNLQGVKKARVDVVAFNVAKAFVAWVVFIRGGVGGESVETVKGGVPGGSGGLLVSAGIGALAGLYEAVLRK